MQSSKEIKALVEARVASGRAPGLVVGVLNDAGREVFAAGVRSIGEPALVTRDTLVEIGSITKVFTALLLADASLRGELALDDPINDFLPAGAKAPDVEGQPIRLLDLATHASGLPSFMDGAPPFGDDWSAYDRAAMLADVAAFQPTQAIGAGFRYSNTGYGLLGIALEAATGLAYEPLLRARVLDPLGMDSTALTLTPALQARTAEPHGLGLARVPRLRIPAMASAGALWSCADDLLTFLAAVCGAIPSPLAPAFALMLTVRRPGPPPPPGVAKVDQAIGWPTMETELGVLLGHAGGTVGMGTMALVCPARHEAVVVLGNSAASEGDFAAYLLNPDHKIVEPPIPDPVSAVPADRAVLARLPGRYAFAPGVECLIEVDDAGLICRPPDAPRLRLLACGPAEFFNPSFDARFTFDLPAAGPATSLTVAGPMGGTATRVS